MAKGVTSQLQTIVEKLKDFTGTGTEEHEHLINFNEEHAGRDLLIGGLTGSVIGAVAGLMAPKAGSKLRQDLADTYEDVSDRTRSLGHKFNRRKNFISKNINTKAGEWLDFAKDVVDYF